MISNEESVSTYKKILAEEALAPELHSVIQHLQAEQESLQNQCQQLKAELSILKTQQQKLSDEVYAPLIYKVIKRLRRVFAPRLGKLDHYAPRNLIIPAKYEKKIKLTTTPTISIATPSFNQAEFIERTIQSVLSQDYPALEFIIQDGASKDESFNIIRRYSQHLKFCESKKDRGQTHAINLAFQHATGDIMAYLNSDDMLMPGCLNYVAHYFNTHPDVDVIYSHRIIIDENDCDIGRWILPAHKDDVLSWADFIPQETLFWRKRLWQKMGGQLDENFHFAMDWDLLLRFRAAGAKMVRVPRFLGLFRKHHQQKTLTNANDIGSEEMTRLRTRCLGKDVTQQEINTHLKYYLIKHTVLNKLYRLGVLRY